MAYKKKMSFVTPLISINDEKVESSPFSNHAFDGRYIRSSDSESETSYISG